MTSTFQRRPFAFSTVIRRWYDVENVTWKRRRYSDVEATSKQRRYLNVDPFAFSTTFRRRFDDMLWRCFDVALPAGIAQPISSQWHISLCATPHLQGWLSHLRSEYVTLSHNLTIIGDMLNYNNWPQFKHGVDKSQTFSKAISLQFASQIKTRTCYNMGNADGLETYWNYKKGIMNVFAEI